MQELNSLYPQETSILAGEMTHIQLVLNAMGKKARDILMGEMPFFFF